MYVCVVCVILTCEIILQTTSLLKVLEMLDPGCDGKLLVSKLTRDEIPQENYVNVKEFLDTLDASNKDGEPQEPENCFGGLIEEWPDDEGGKEFDWSNKREKYSGDHQVDIGEDDIQVRTDQGCNMLDTYLYHVV